MEISGALDKGDRDPLDVEPLPVRNRLPDAFLALGFRFRSADLEAGHTRGTAQSLPSYQEIEFAAAPQYAHACSSVEVTFLAGPHQVEVVLETDRRGGLFGHGGDVVRTHVLVHAAADRDLTALVDGWIRQAL
ncbi:sporulation protein [Kitasatospora sp. NBC_00315]